MSTADLKLAVLALGNCNCFSYLAGVLASLEESGTEHVGGDLSRVGRPAAAVAQDGGIQAPQTIRVVA